ncbi:glycosyltransferase family 4 protein [Demequina capsici]|uniref:Glycosyltransferase family 4 protein n=1 Tax=Demequina capsici TaxID=3075620 RepID=A0AA96F6T8_9MICO|nr:glycosyltransferase family 4 protein [Demequina sp. OYTSA14]WNM24364.1 glycosyltransferase family 4 protein [Demequina sp. OYTSA14]
MSRGAPLRVMGWGTYDASRHPRAGILLDGLRASGADVVEVNQPDSTSTAERVDAVSSMGAALGTVLKLPTVWFRLARRARKEMRRKPVDALLVGYLGHMDVIAARVLFPRTPIVLDHLIFAADTARDRSSGSGLMQRLLGVLDRTAIASATVVVLDTDEHLAMLPNRARRKGLVVPVGAPDAWFESGASRAAGDPDAPLSVIFYGLFTPLQGAETIGAAARLLHERGANVAITMVGTGQDHAATVAAAGEAPVTWIDWVQPADLPALVASHDVCLGIVGTTPKGSRVVPNKVYQGLAARCAVITSDTPPQRRMLQDAVRYVPTGDAEALADAIAGLATDRTELAALALRGAELAQARFSPAALGGELMARIAQVTA